MSGRLRCFTFEKLPGGADAAGPWSHQPQGGRRTEGHLSRGQMETGILPVTVDAFLVKYFLVPALCQKTFPCQPLRSKDTE